MMKRFNHFSRAWNTTTDTRMPHFQRPSTDAGWAELDEIFSNNQVAQFILKYLTLDGLSIDSMDSNIRGLEIYFDRAEWRARDEFGRSLGPVLYSRFGYPNLDYQTSRMLAYYCARRIVPESIEYSVCGIPSYSFSTSGEHDTESMRIIGAELYVIRPLKRW